jgi:metallo-beta-lactamase class B
LRRRPWRPIRRTFAKLAATQADILLTSHPEMADVLEREARRGAGKADAFVDPAALPALVDESRTTFEDALAAAEKASK